MIKIITCFVFVFFVSCTKQDNSISPVVPIEPLATRSFYMGFTPWPYAATVEAVNDTYSKINLYGDIVDHHFMTGIPWQNAYNNVETYRINIEGDISDRKTKTVAGKIIYLALDSLNSNRNGIVPYWDADFNEPMANHSGESVNWNTVDFDSPAVITAFTNFSLYLIDKFDPLYFNYATEISELILNDTAKFNKFKTFAQQVYNNIKASYPNLTILVSVALKHPDSVQAETIKDNMSSLSSWYDMLGISVYPYAFFYHSDSGNPRNLPARWLDQAKDIAGGKPLAITETSWAAEDLNMGAPYNFFRASNETYQNEYVDILFTESNALDINFVIWFSVSDYNSLWLSSLNDEVSKVWRDSGLYSEITSNLTPRASLTTWNNWLLRQKE